MILVALTILSVIVGTTGLVVVYFTNKKEGK